MDAASHTGIANIRDLIDSAHYKPNTARYKVYIIDEVHMLSKPAFTGLLKTLEEPPKHVKFIFATTEARKVPVTVLSRRQRFDLKRIEVELAAHSPALPRRKAPQPSRARSADGRAARARCAMRVDPRSRHRLRRGKVDADAVRGQLGLADRARISICWRRCFGDAAARSTAGG